MREYYTDVFDGPRRDVNDKWGSDDSVSWVGVMLCMLMLLLLGLCASYALVPYYEPHRTCYGCW